MLYWILSAVVAYLLGSLSFGIILSKLKYKKDIRDYGSNNAGMTNTLRTFGKGAAAFVFIFDAAKGVAAALLAKYVLCGNQDPVLCAYIAVFFVVVGHMFPIYFGFKGGKGAATALGATTALQPLTLPLVMIPFFIVVLTTKMVSLASIIAGAVLPIATFCIYYFQDKPALVPTLWTALLAGLIIFMHRSNIQRILKGEERKIGADKVNTDSETPKQSS